MLTSSEAEQDTELAYERCAWRGSITIFVLIYTVELIEELRVEGQGRNWLG